MWITCASTSCTTCRSGAASEGGRTPAAPTGTRNRYSITELKALPEAEENVGHTGAACSSRGSGLADSAEDIFRAFADPGFLMSGVFSDSVLLIAISNPDAMAQAQG